MSSGEGQQFPITIEEAARIWRCSVRRLKSIAKRHGIGKRAGRAVLLDRAALERLYEALPDNGSRSAAAAELSASRSEATVAKKLPARLADSPRKSPRKG